MDLLIGNFSGGVNYLPDISQPNVSGVEAPQAVAINNINIFPNPAFDAVRIRYQISDIRYILICNNVNVNVNIYVKYV